MSRPSWIPPSKPAKGYSPTQLLEDLNFWKKLSFEDSFTQGRRVLKKLPPLTSKTCQIKKLDVSET
jgi:hypothetical protein